MQSQAAAVKYAHAHLSPNKPRVSLSTHKHIIFPIEATGFPLSLCGHSRRLAACCVLNHFRHRAWTQRARGGRSEVDLGKRLSTSLFTTLAAWPFPLLLHTARCSTAGIVQNLKVWMFGVLGLQEALTWRDIYCRVVVLEYIMGLVFATCKQNKLSMEWVCVRVHKTVVVLVLVCLEVCPKALKASQWTLNTISDPGKIHIKTRFWDKAGGGLGLVARPM